MSETTEAADTPRQHEDNPELNELVWIRHPGLTHKPAQQVTRAKARIKELSGYVVVGGPDDDVDAAGGDESADAPAPNTRRTRKAAANTEEQS
ncbi:hypothetical protein [Pseudonocardia alni]|uniref:hypothetical protein n=1 Tax=Pseudonocardia alni TaxID=33907 RepID=UPI0027A444A6|nr:hypothetical protein PaSha_14065 [Pseudonocardia alni]WFG47485.1 hypothetical protein PaSha_28805 [Pseudonocardia alni]